MDDVINREGARVILVGPDGRVLLFQGGDPGDPEAGLWWMTPGGGVDPGESTQAAAARELREETGFVVGELGPIVHERTADFRFMGKPYRQHEVFYRVRLEQAPADLDRSGWTAVERDTLTDARWWSAAELRSTAETIYPESLADLI
ncbi:NUDIX domain-containing protein [Kineosporia sp. NBRC 101731]|uniref:NUDIX hydrolase n=1 Tax=Kineosporia sp. NBRC 101731 TaxID=3032199 RepID=UPI0024A0292F|nr:NUDIX domain-containing protein [Kineosporia sp. NBRC 101731]GLY29598.1 DNA mismatch repair protein MutT [Kineosporia sp. NBRC 101731]